MDPTISVSKGCFVFKNGATKAQNRSERSKKKVKYSPLLSNEMISEQFYKTYSETWNNFQTDLESIQNEIQNRRHNDLVEFVQNAHATEVDEVLPTAALLTGVNQPDHYQHFTVIAEKLEKMNASVSILQARDCATLKSTIETMVSCFMRELNENEEFETKKLKRSQYTMQVLQSWYESEFSTKNRTLVVILTDFECFEVSIISDFILILSSYCESLQIVLILGVATSASVLHNSLPYHVTSKVRLKIFQTQPASAALTEIIDKIVLSPKYSFNLSGKIFKFLIDIFLFYDFSINGFIQGFKYCMLEHFLQGNAFALCNNFQDSLKIVQTLTHQDIESIRRLLSFRPYVESITNRHKIILILTEDDYFKKKLPKMLHRCHLYLKTFRCFFEFLYVLVNDLPKGPLGRQRRELYPLCVSSNIVDLPEFKESWQILSLFAKEEFISKISSAVEHSTDYVNKHLLGSEIDGCCKMIVLKKLDEIKSLLSIVTTATSEIKSKASSQADLTNLTRHQLKEKLIQMSKQEKQLSDFTKSVNDILDFIKNEIVSVHLQPFHSGAPALHELFVFSDITAIRKHIMGSPRAALHSALNNPHHYLQCNCCELEESSIILPTLPDISVAYKLHLECGRMINLFDWLQAFRSVVDYSEENQDHIDPIIQARFTRAVAELQFLGYIKSSKRKSDHVARLTW